MTLALLEIPKYIPRSNRRYFSIANVAGIGGAIGHTALLMAFLYFDITPMVWFNLGSILLFVLVFLLNRIKKQPNHWSTIGIYLSVLEIILHAVTAILLLGWSSGFYAYLFLVFIMVFLVRKTHDKLGLLVSIINLGMLVGLSVYTRLNPNPPIELATGAVTFFATYNIISAAGLLVAGVYYYKITANNVESELETLYGRITDSIRYADRIQRVLLPEKDLLKSYTKEHFIYYKPRDIVSGDFYWIKHFKEQDQLVIAMLDCTGHGVPGAFMTVMASTLLESIVVNRGIRFPNEILEELHKGVVSLLKQQYSNRQEGMDMGICTISLSERKVHYSGAKRSLLLVREDCMKEIKATRRSVGGKWRGRKKPPEFDLHSFSIGGEETSLYLFSDGYTDQFGGEKDQKFTARKLREMIRGMQGLSMGKQKEILSETFDIWSKGRKQIDDVTVIGLKI